MKQESGFSLIELMIVLVIILLLATIGYPSYIDHVRAAKRSEAQMALVELAQWMERQATVNGRYTDANGGAPALPFATSPKNGVDVVYNIALVANAGTYTLTATPAGDQLNDGCGNLSLDQTGVKSSTGPKNDCW